MTLSSPQHRVGGPPRAVSGPRSRRATKIVVALAVSTGLWLGFTAPTVSPVAPPDVVSPAPAVAPIVQVVPAAPAFPGSNPMRDRP